ncbi:MAG: sulfatase [bacterium]
MDRRRFIGQALAAAALGASGGLKAKPRRPNFVFFLADDLGWMDAGCYGSGFYETPAIDRLAEEGMRFTDAYAASPVCSPTRASIMSGKYPARMNTTQYFGGHRQGELDTPDYVNHLPLDEFTLAEAMKAAGYSTFFLGKWHLGREPYFPGKQGFDVNIGGNHTGLPVGGYFSPYFNPRLQGGPPGEYLTDRLTDEALSLMESAARPFLLFLSHYAVHVPLQAEWEDMKKYWKKCFLNPRLGRFGLEGKYPERVVQDHPVYAGMITALDKSLGRVMDKLAELGIKENTIVIFMSDNGGLSTAEGWPTSNVPLRAGKGWLYEGGIREPMIVKWPGVTRPGSVCSEPVMSTDFYPSMLEMAGLPLRPDQHVDGASLCPLLRGEEGLGRDSVYWHYPHYSNQGGKPSAAIRSGPYKLIEFYHDPRVELYNLDDDISEEHDLSEKIPAKAQELRSRLRRWQKEVDARMPEQRQGG